MSQEYKFYDKKNLGISRADMPQISQDNLDDFLLHFAPKVKVSKLKMSLSLLKPTQNEINEEKVLAMIADEEYDWKERIYIISSDNYLLDGHHSFAVGLEFDPEQEVIVYRVNLPMKSLLKRTKQLKFATKVDLQDNILKAEEIGYIVSDGCRLITDMHLEEQLQNAYDDYGIEKAIPSHLVKKIIINKQGHSQTVYVDPSKTDGTKYDFKKHPYKGSEAAFLGSVEMAVEEVLKKQNITYSKGTSVVPDADNTKVLVLMKNGEDMSIEWYKTKQFAKTGVIGIKLNGKIYEKKIKNHETELEHEKSYLKEIEEKRELGKKVIEKVEQATTPSSGLAEFGGFKVGEKVFYYDGDKLRDGEIKAIKHHEKYDKFGTALIEDSDTGKTVSRSLKKVTKMNKDEGFDDSTKPQNVEKLTTQNLSSVLENIGDNPDFIKWCQTNTPAGEYLEGETKIPKYDLINGYCDAVASYVKLHHLDDKELTIKNYGEHVFLEYKGKYYDGENTNGVSKPSELKYFENMSKIAKNKLDLTPLNDQTEAWMNEHKGTLSEEPTKSLSESMKGNQNAKKNGSSEEEKKPKKTKQENDPFAESEFEVVKTGLGGSNGAKLVKQKKTGELYVTKNLGLAQAVNEYNANNIYNSFGISTPESFLSQSGKLYTKYIPDTVNLGEYLQSASIMDKGKIYKQIKDGFVVDALLANWDVAGLSLDNIVVDPKTKKVHRIDNGGALFYRAQGAEKGNDFEDTVTELESLKDPKKNPNTAQFFKTLSNEDIAKQIKHVLENKDTYLATAKQYGSDGQKLLKRLSHLETIYNQQYKPESKKDEYFGNGLYKKTGIEEVDKVYEQIDKLMTITPEDKNFLETNSTLLSDSSNAKTEYQKWKNGSFSASKTDWMNKAFEAGLTAEEFYYIQRHTGSMYTEFNDVLEDVSNQLGGNINPNKILDPNEKITSSQMTHNDGKFSLYDSKHPNDAYWDTILGAAKTINHHFEDKQFNMSKIEALKDTQASLEQVAKEIKAKPSLYSAADKEMIKHYNIAVKNIVKAKEKGTKVPLIEQYHASDYEKKSHNEFMDKKNKTKAEAKSKEKQADLVIKTKLEEFKSIHQKVNLLRVKHLTSGLAKLEKSGKFAYKGDLTRKITIHEQDVLNAVVTQHHEGAYVFWQRANSTSKNSSTWSGNIKFNISKHVGGVDVQHISSFGSEAEVLMKPFTLIKVNKVVQNYHNDYSFDIEQIG